MDQPSSPLDILLVEDSEVDIRLTEVALKKANFKSTLNVVRDGKAALEYLNNEGDFADATCPDIVLLDLSLPNKSGVEVLKEMRADPRLAKLPVVVLTTSDSEEDIFHTFEQAVTCYVTKPVDLKKFLSVIEMIDGFWSDSL